MPNSKNIAQLQDIESKLNLAKNVVLASYQGLDVATQSELRAKVKEVGGEINITKNTLIALGIKNRISNLPQTLTDALEGQTAITYGFTDVVSATKVLVEYAKLNEKLVIKAGLIMGENGEPDKVLSEQEVKRLAQMPTRHELLGMLARQLNAPMTGFATVLSGTTRSLLYALNAIKDKKSTN
jgi:large subunit ribosomal protein L10